jgi:hypothetical protein
MVTLLLWVELTRIWGEAKPRIARSGTKKTLQRKIRGEFSKIDFAAVPDQTECHGRVSAATPVIGGIESSESQHFSQ